MDVMREVRPAPVALAAVSAADRSARGEGPVAVRRSAADGVRGDLEAVFRRDYATVVAVAGRVLGRRDAADDVAQEVFLSFNRSPVPASEARAWLCVAAAHAALN